ncbi:MAG TPA: class I SAM-dependent methyltransferase [Firmicutes bacterium]|nr:class I SAM-dependent methyltransferase [Bacillota bacterium]
MVFEWESEWEKIYQQHQEVNYDVLPSVKFATEIFKRNDCIKIIDLGHESSQHSMFLAANGFKVIPAKFSEMRIDFTVAQPKKSNNNNVRVQHDMRHPCVDDQCVDGILCVWPLEYGALDEAYQQVSEMHRLVKPGGLVVMDYISAENNSLHKVTEFDSQRFYQSTENMSISYHYYTEEEIQTLYINFAKVDIVPLDYQFIDQKQEEQTLKAFMVIATK